MSTAEELNDRATVLAGDGLGGSYLWKDGEWMRLTFGGFVNDLNKFEAMTGAYSPISGRTHAFIYRGGVLQDLGTLGGTFSAAHAINDSDRDQRPRLDHRLGNPRARGAFEGVRADSAVGRRRTRGAPVRRPVPSMGR